LDNTYPNDILKHIDDLQKDIGAAKNISDVEKAWEHFYRIKGYVERTWPNDKATMESCRRLKSGLSQYTLDVREGMPSPCIGWHVELTALRRLVSPRYDKDGWPL